MISGGAQQIRLLVLAGTREARQVVSELSRDQRFDLIASLAGATPSPLPLAAPVHSGGFGGAEGMAQFCRERSIDAIIDVTHPFARHISRNAAAASLAAEIPALPITGRHGGLKRVINGASLTAGRKWWRTFLLEHGCFWQGVRRRLRCLPCVMTFSCVPGR